MSIGTERRLEVILNELVSKASWSISNCIVTNERGLIIAEKQSYDSLNSVVAAMISLLSDTALRINKNLGLMAPETTTIESEDTTFSICEFLVRSKRFRIGVITTGKKHKRWIIGRKTKRAIDTSLRIAAGKIKDILEGSPTDMK